MRRLLVAEKFSAALRLAVALSEGTVKRLRADGVSQFEFSRAGDVWRVFPLRGHLVNLDYPPEWNDWDRADLDALIDADPVAMPTDPVRTDALRRSAQGIDEVVVATDYDREGELIGLEAVRTVHAVAAVPVRRARFSSLTRRELAEAFGRLTDLDERLAEAAAVRETVDLAWGAVLTRFLSMATGQRGRDVLSAGRVQTPTLGLVADREREIEEFVPAPFWRVVASLAKGAGFRAEHLQSPFWHRDEAEAVRARAGLATEGWIVSVDAEVQEERPPVPLSTTLFLGLADRAGFPAARAMAIAESLYRAGLISYPRTDNTVYPRGLGLRRILEDLRASELAEEVEAVVALPALRPTRGRTESTDHPPIHPTGAARRGDLKTAAGRVYELVVRRFLATLSPPAVHEVTTVRVDLDDEPFAATTRRLVEPGWRAVVPREDPDTAPPAIDRGGAVEVCAVAIEEGETPPPPRYTQGTLIQEMERRGLGTKSTRHEIVQKLYDRGYVTGRRIRTTGGGRAVVEALQVHAPSIARPETTAELERDLEAVAGGRTSPGAVIAKSRERLRAVLREVAARRTAIARWIREGLEWERDHGPCDRCGTGRMLLRKARAGTRFLGCSNYPDCRNSRPALRDEFVVQVKRSEASLAP